MCERRNSRLSRRTVAVGRRHGLIPMIALLAAVHAPTGLGAQGADSHRARLREQLRVLEALADEANRAYGDYRAGLAGLLSDTVRAGTLTVITAPQHRVLVEEAAENVWGVLSGALGPSATLLAGERFAAMAEGGPLVRTPHLIAIPFRDSADAAELTARLRTSVERLLAVRMSTPAGTWFTPGWLDTTSTFGLRSLYVELVVASAPAGRDCFMGSLSACAEYLGLPGEYDPYQRWYSAEQRTSLAARAAASMRRRERDRWDPAFEPCLRGDERACTRFLETYRPFVGRAPASALARQTLQRLAIQTGGPGAYGRAISSPDTSVRGRLEAASGLPMETLIERWRDTIVQQAVDRPPVRRTTAWVAVLWVAALAVVAGKSSRWSRV